MSLGRRKKTFPKIVGMIFLISGVIFFNHQGYLNPLKNYLFKVPLLGSAGIRSGSLNVKELTTTLFSLNRIKEENKQLKETQAEVLSLHKENQELKHENDELRNQLKLLPRQEFDLLGAQVIANDPLASDEVIIINRGQKDGVKEGMTLISKEKVLIGWVIEVQPTKSKILLTVSSAPSNSFGASFTVGNIIGVAQGQYNLEIILKLLPNQLEIKEGETVITAGNKQKYPPGLLVGKVVNVEKTADGLFQQAVVKPFYSVNNLKFVFLIK